MNSSQLQSTLNSTGKQIHDSETNLTFSRINVYSALISIDSEPPVVNLTSPANNSAYSGRNQTFECNATDLKLKKVTLDIWNSTVLYYNSSADITGQNYSAQFNVSSIPSNSYNWNCMFEDENNNIGYSIQNSSFSILPGIIYLSPSNNTYTNQNRTLSCNSTFFWTNQTLSNVTFNLFNSSALIYNKTNSISGTSNLTNFIYNFTSQEGYTWGCFFYTNESTRIDSDNYTLTYDITSPKVNITSPANGTSKSGGTQTMTFSYNATDNIAMQNCSLQVDGNKVSNSTITQKQNQFNYSLSPGNYNWEISCTDKAGNFNASATRRITIESVQITSSSSGGGSTGGSGGYTPPKESPTGTKAIKTSEGYNLVLSDNTGYFFALSNSEKHLLQVDNTTENSAYITVRSSPVTFLLNVGQSINLNLSSPAYYDTNVRLNSIKNSLANITIKEINESNRLFHISNQSSVNGTGQSPKLLTKRYAEILVAVAILILVAILYLLERKRLSKIVEIPPGKEKKKSKDASENKNSKKK